jgi:MOSC domain-containing protein YiiM
MSKQPRDVVVAELDGFVDDKHRGYSRVCYEGDTEPEGTVRRNNRQWSGMSKEEVEEIQAALDLSEPLSPEDLGVNIFVQGIEAFSSLPKGTRLVFPSGATLMVEAFNPPCTEMGDKIASLYTTRSGQSLTRRQFLKEAKRKRGLVGVVDVRGELTGGDSIIVEPYRAPKLT